MDFVTVKSRQKSLRVGVTAGDIVIRSLEDDRTETEIRVPGAVMDALLSGPGDQLDIAAAIRALNGLGAGIYVTAREGRSDVRIWVDDKSSQ